jgi:hypothetical protein
MVRLAYVVAAAAVTQFVVERLMAFLRSTACGGDELLRRHIAGQIVDLAEKYAPDTTWFVGVMAEVGCMSGHNNALSLLLCS